MRTFFRDRHRLLTWLLAAAVLLPTSVRDAEAQTIFRETFGAANAQLPTATSTADGNWASAACLNGQIIPGNSPSDTTGSTHRLFHNTGACALVAGSASWRTVTAITVVPNTTYVFSYWSQIGNTVSNPVLTQEIVPNTGTVTVDSTTTPAWPSAGPWVQRTLTFTTSATTTAVDLRINNANTGSTGNDFALDDISLSVQSPICNVAANGSFESPNIQNLPDSTFTSGWAVYRTGTAAVDGWTVIAGTIDQLRYFNNASNGDQSIDLWGTAPATIQQTFTGLTPGVTYGFSIDYSGLTTDPLASVHLDQGSGFQLVQTLTPTAAGVNNGNGGLPGTRSFTVTWATFTHTFVATGTQATIRFVNRVAPGAFNTGLFIDNFAFGGQAPCEDYGDAPASYGTLTADNGARHAVGGPYLGAALPDIDLNGQPNAAANGDDGNGADEDGVTVPLFKPGTTAAIQVVVGNATPTTRLQGWVDWAGDGSFAEPGDQIIVDGAVVNGANTFNVTVPASTTFGTTIARFRIADTAGLSYNGAAGSGEVEDYLATLDAEPPGGVFPTCPISQNPPPTNFTIKQRWATPNTAGQRTLPYQTPVVGDLFGTGQIVAVVAADNGFIGNVGTPTASAKDLHIIRGSDGALLSTIVTPRFNWFGHAVAAIADVDGDGIGEVFMKAAHHDDMPAGQRGRLFAYKYTAGTWAQWWVSDTRYDYANNTANTNGDRRSGHALSLADFNADGVPEVFIGNQIFNARTGARLAARPAADPAGCVLEDCIQGATVAVDMDDDGLLELVAGNVVYKVTITNPNGAAGNTIAPWRQSNAAAYVGDGWTAIADIDLDGNADVVVVRAIGAGLAARMFVWDGQTGTILGSVTTGLGTSGSEPLIGDIDGDGGPEIVFATANQLNAFDYVPGSGLVRQWGVATNDASGQTSFALFDFNSDGKKELVYRDEENVRIIDGSGATATDLATFPCFSGTRAEMPVVAALDGSRQARILVTCATTNTVDFNARGSLRAYETASFPWATTRPVWNQQTYFVSHINNDLSIPAEQFPHWAEFSDPAQSCSAGVNRPLNGFQQQVTDLDRNTGCPVTCPLPANVSIEKSASTQVATPGAPITYTITVTNTGPGDSPGTQIQDPFPAGIDSAQWTCTASGGASCPAPNSGGVVLPPGDMLNQTVALPANGTLVYSIVAMVANAPPAQVTNTASVTGSVVRCLPDGTLPPCEDTTTSQRATADLTISKVSTPNPYIPGDPLTYTIIVSNLGPHDAPGAVVQDTFPGPLSSFTWSCAANTAGATCSASGGPGSINDSVTLPAGGSVTYTVTGTAPAGSSTVLTNVATVTPRPGMPDPTPGNNSAQDVNNAQITADLRVAKSGTPTPFVPGQTLTYTIVVSNAGPSDVTGARVTDPLPPAFAGFAWSCTAGAGTSCATTSGSGDIDVLVNLAAGTSVTITSSGTVPSGFTSAASNSVTVTPPPDTRDPVPGNNTSTYSNPPDLVTDLAITKTQSPDPYVPGGTLTYTLLVTNHGPSDVTNARVQDVVPGVMSNVAWTCVAAGGGASCATPSGLHVVDALVTLPVGTTATFTVAGTVAPSTTGVLTNTATIATPSNATDPNPGNNEATANSAGAPLSNLGIEKTASPDPFTPGAPLTYSIVVRNDGPSDALNARVQDLFPAELSSFTWTCSGSGGSACGTASGQSLIDVFVDLPAGTAVTFTATGTVPPDHTGGLTNTATVTPPPGTTDPTPSNNTSTSTIGVQSAADLSLTKTSSPNPYVPGMPITYTIVASNAGPSALIGGRVRDGLPAVLQNVAWTCTTVNGTCPSPDGIGNLDALVDIQPGGTVTFELTADVPTGTHGTLVNAATVVPPAGTIDTNPSNNAATNFNPSVPPPGPADLQITQEFPGVAQPNGLLTFRLVTKNLGSHPALNPYITGMIPPGTLFVSATPSDGGMYLPPDNPPAPDPITGYPIAGSAAVAPLKAIWPGLMKPGETRTLEFTVRVAPGTRTGQILWSCFWTWSDTEDPYHANNVVDAYLFVDDRMTPVGDLTIDGAALSEGVIGTELPTRVGTPVPMRFWVTNHGPNRSRGQYALILDQAGTIGIDALETQQGWVAPSGPASAAWDTGSLEPGQSVQLNLTVRVLTPSSVKLFAQRIAGIPGDPNASNERATIVLDGYGPAGTAGRWVAVGNVDGAGAGEIVTGAGQGETPQVRVYTGAGADTQTRFFAYERPFIGGVQVASCDVDGNGTAEIITVPGPGRAPTVRVLNVTGGVVTELVTFDAFEPNFRGGLSIACADLDADGAAELVVGAGPGRAPEVQVYSVGLQALTLHSTFLAYENEFRGGVRVAAGVYPGRPGWLDPFGIVTTPGPGRAAELRLWSPTGAGVAQVVISSATAGVIPTLGDVNGDGQLDLVIAPDNGRPELVRIYDVNTATLLGYVPGGSPAFPVGVRIAVGLLQGGPGGPEIVVGNGPGGHPRVRIVYWPAAGPVQRLEILPLEIP